MPDRSSPDYRSLMITSGLLIVAGWSGLYLLVITTLPTVGPRWLFFFLLPLAATGIVCALLPPAVPLAADHPGPHPAAGAAAGRRLRSAGVVRPPAGAQPVEPAPVTLRQLPSAARLPPTQ